MRSDSKGSYPHLNDDNMIPPERNARLDGPNRDGWLLILDDGGLTHKRDTAGVG